MIPLLYAHVLAMHEHKDGKCTIDDILRTLLVLDQNVTRNKDKLEEYINSIFVRSVDGRDVYLSSLRKLGNGHLDDFEYHETVNLYAFRNALIKRTIIKEKRFISQKAIANRFGVCTKTVRKIVKELVAKGEITVQENYIIVNAADRKDGGFKREKHLPVNSLRISNNYCVNRNSNGSAKPKAVLDKHNYKMILGNPHKYYYFAYEVWMKLGNDGPVDNDVLYSMSRSKTGSAQLYKAIRKSRRYSEKRVLSGFI